MKEQLPQSTDSILFYSQTFGTVRLDQVVEEIARFIGKEPARFYKIMIGTDSDADISVPLVTAVTVWRVGNGAIHFWTESEVKVFHTFRDRIWAEAIASITLAQEIRSRLTERLGSDFFWDGNEIHVDIGERGPTRELIKSIEGLIRGYNFQPVIKPFAIGASSVADRHT